MILNGSNNGCSYIAMHGEPESPVDIPIPPRIRMILPHWDKQPTNPSHNQYERGRQFKLRSLQVTKKSHLMMISLGRRRHGAVVSDWKQLAELLLLLRLRRLSAPIRRRSRRRQQSELLLLLLEAQSCKKCQENTSSSTYRQWPNEQASASILRNNNMSLLL